MLPKHFRRLNSIYFRLLRRAVGVKAAYISRVSNITIWELAGRPTTPTNSPTANQTFIDMLGYSAERPFPSHCVLFSLERPNRTQLMLDYLQLPINHFFPHHPQITNPMTLQQLINKTPRLTGFLAAAPTCASLFPFLQLARPEQQRAGQG